MKKVILTALAVLGFAFANAQTEKGKFLVSGSTSLGFSSFKTKFKADNGQTEDGPKTSSFNVKPAAGYFVANNFMIGLALDLSTSSTKYGTSKETQSSTTVLPQVAYYFGKSNVKPFLNAGFGFVTVSNSQIENPSGTVLGFNGGVAYFISKSISLDFGVGYQSVSLKIEQNSSSQSITSTTSGFASQVGIAVYF